MAETSRGWLLVWARSAAEGYLSKEDKTARRRGSSKAVDMDKYAIMDKRHPGASALPASHRAGGTNSPIAREEDNEVVKPITTPESSINKV